MTVQERSTAVAELAAGPIEYRLERRGGAAVVLFHGGHMRAGLSYGEEVFASLDSTLVVPSRPGYGRTPLRADSTPSGFADEVRELCARLGIDRVAAAVGVSAGGRAAVALAARHPDLVERLVLMSAVGPAPWPGRWSRGIARAVFGPRVEKTTWALVRALMLAAPAVGLRAMMSNLSTESAGAALAELSDAERSELVALFARMRSGRGFANDLDSGSDLTGGVTQPTLVIASRRDGSVPFTHAQTLVRNIGGAELVVSDASSHLLWYSADYPGVADRIGSFLAAPKSR